MSAIVEAKDYICTEELAELRLRIRKFAEDVLAPKAREIDEHGFDREHYQKVMDAKLAAIAVSKGERAPVRLAAA